VNPSVAAELARQVLADEHATADYEIGVLNVPPEAAAVIDAALRRRYGADYHSPDDVTLIRA
jgi:hypothetical protein